MHQLLYFTLSLAASAGTLSNLMSASIADFFLALGAGITVVGVSPDAFTFSWRYIVLFTGELDGERLTSGCRVQ
ncbi:hypothetical protein [Dickeya solani]|uniref:hypothetical protein n=1 Tax=Dickeya solani TaxID=1089444 RepID=UPI0003A23FED|nr:hypothetical protein [Dickeya solani]AUC43438.1 hypothetical protein D083_3089 [Dickeya solani RNS 08.23.3.1.A]MBJ2332618.1 hypothetical protein [Dickeya solani]MBJ2338603.1 hypothetical protein [Dickeya solani]MBJ2353461.1 hypothetical protein [Dickeya solani]MCZ0783710.1 hypothetical protein [Dickeya solani]